MYYMTLEKNGALNGIFVSKASFLSVYYIIFLSL